MFQSISKNTFNWIIRSASRHERPLSILKPYIFCCSALISARFATKKKRIIELNSSAINISTQTFNLTQQKQPSQRQYFLQARKKIQSLPWQQMRFDQLCNLDQQILQALQTQLKKDKFNISDDEFLKDQLKNGKQIPLTTYEQLDMHYKKVYSLLKNTNHFYEEYPNINQLKRGYLNEIYITDLKNDQQLIHVISRFVKHVAKPQKLEALAQPTFVKYLLSLKRQLLLQGIHFETRAEKNQAIQKGEKLVQSYQKQQLPRIKILEILNYEYEFWQDVKHNRAKNGGQENFVIDSKEVPNPNQTMLLKELYPTVKIKYIARIKSLKQRQHCFCLKADLLIQIDEKMKRKIKVEWKGPSSKNTNEQKPLLKKKSVAQPDQSQQQSAPRVNYLVIDYENMYDGNPTIRPIFHF